MLYRVFEISCSREHLVELSDWLNEHLDFEKGEDFNKLSPTPPSPKGDGDSHSEDAYDVDWERLCCKTDRETMAGILEWFAAYIEEQRDGRTITDNKVRMARNLASKLRKKNDRED